MNTRLNFNRIGTYDNDVGDNADDDTEDDGDDDDVENKADHVEGAEEQANDGDQVFHPLLERKFLILTYHATNSKVLYTPTVMFSFKGNSGIFWFSIRVRF